MCVKRGFTEAEALRKARDFSEAGRRFHALWKEEGTPDCGWRYAYCLRKAGYPAPALAVIVRVRKHSPDHRGVRMEHGWCLYEGELKPSLARADDRSIMSAARSIVEAGAEDLLLRLAVFAAVGAARRKGEWTEVLKWCRQLDPASLSDRKPSGRKGISELERWYYAKLKALAELKQWEDLKAEASTARERFPLNADFGRWQAVAKARTGSIEEAKGQLEVLWRCTRNRWYLAFDLALLHLEEGDTDQAWKWGKQAAVELRDLRTGVRLFATVAEMRLAMGRAASAARHLALCLLIRQKEGWPVSRSLTELRDRIGAALPEDNDFQWDTVESRHLAACRAEWNESEAEVGLAAAKSPGEQLEDAAPAQYEGRVRGITEGRSFTFIRMTGRTDGQDIFVHLNELPDEARREGARVTFFLAAAYDRKKQRESKKAVDVRLKDS